MDLLLALRREPSSSEFSTDGSLTSASAVRHCGGRDCNKTSTGEGVVSHGGGLSSGALLFHVVCTSLLFVAVFYENFFYHAI